ncbi:MAG TPA: hypothetical protein VIX87_06400 [Steroidobacteraceae bacterium]
MAMIFWLVAACVVISGVVAGASFDVAVVKLPTRKRIGAVAYANFARGNDLGNGIIVYPTVAILALLLIAGATLAVYFLRLPQTVLLALFAACAGTVASFFCTAKAAPNMLSLRHAPDDEKLITEKLDSFSFWHTYRFAFQFLTFIATVRALVAMSEIV